MTTATEERLEVTLETIREGAAAAMFLEQLDKVLSNIMDERTSPKKARKVILTVTLRPFVMESLVRREQIDVDVSAKSVLAPIETGEATHHARKVRGGYQLELGAPFGE